jgi:hypothetical protein
MDHRHQDLAGDGLQQRDRLGAAGNLPVPGLPDLGLQGAPPFADCLSLAQVRQQPVEPALNNAVAFAGTGFQARTIEHLDASAAVVDQSASRSVPAAAVTPSRRTPGMSAIICGVT